ncbi:cbb3-type cytochrome oxidase assembly protein CcoS [Ekhidna sp.]|uniref:cbb3-type cytochrome oxidase assembly protein CcoS n=1 Tax=Ekhidna sp. TaxID=2608089 RepID=UPI003297D652
MSVIFILIACSLLLAGSFLAAFLWASRSGQFEDDYTPSVRILFEDEGPTVSSNSINNKPSDQCQKTAKK